MTKLKIGCEEEFDLSPVEEAFSRRIAGDALLSAELVFTDEEGIRALNARERGKDAVTDVLSFPNLDGICKKPLMQADYPFDTDEEGRVFLGSVVICTARAREQAEEYGHSYARELHYLLVHGVMHCLGYDHTEADEKAAMRAAEESVLCSIGITRERREEENGK